MSYSEYYFCSRKETENRYQEYGGKIQHGTENTYQEYGDPKMAGTGSILGKSSAPAHVDMKAWDDKFENFLVKQEKIKADRIAKRTAYCDEKGIQGQLREDIIKGKIRIEDYEKIAEHARDVVEETSDERSERLLKEASVAIAPFLVPEQPAEAPETPVEEPVAEQPVETTDEPVEKPKKRSKKKSAEEV